MQKSLAVLLGLVVLSICALTSVEAVGHEYRAAGDPHWTYEAGSADGPDNWYSLLRPDGTVAYPACGPYNSTLRQSPIDIQTHSTVLYGLYSALKMERQTDSENVLWHNTGHTVEVEIGGGGLSGGPILTEEYQLVQFHFHAPSEHTVNGHRYPLEVHFVHKMLTTGDLAVVSVLFTQGHENQWLKTFWNPFPTSVDDTHQVNVRPYDGIPKGSDYWHYKGSLTTPPCSEIVEWIVMKKTQTASAAQINKVLADFGTEFGNSRPVQRVNGRTVWDVPQGHHHTGFLGGIHASVGRETN